MTKQEIQEKVTQVVCQQLQVDVQQVQPNSRFVDDLGADSLDLTELVVAFEDAFDLEIPDADFDALSTVSNVVEYLSQRLA
ncbi:acyl carrier protein [Alicyclobacillus contaminans]|uniref:acyl carrier protein n=1 Tax=Alicyclobacillus contaminans TaxID=392016 RepID=UPI00054DE75C|nr:acyl carrier protein [Alicyclobacillus contaminans]